jgi:rSAM/selenodomain-associated transferase 2
LVVVDGGSDDATPLLAAPFADQVLQGPRGRAAQMNAGARACASDVLLFLHADTVLPEKADQRLLAALDAGSHWGRFDVRLDSPRACLKVVAWFMNWRSRLTGIATGDQAMFMRRSVFDAACGFPDIALMEDIAMSARLRRHAPPACLKAQVTTSARRWEKHGVWRTVWLMWRLRAAYFFGADPAQLAVRYGYRPRAPLSPPVDDPHR